MFQSKHGTLDITIRSNREVGIQINYFRLCARHGGKNGHPILKQEDIDVLNSLGFIWDKSHEVGIAPSHAGWMGKYNEYKDLQDKGKKVS